MLTLNGKPIITERFPNNETKVKDFENTIIDGENVLEFHYTSDDDFIILMFVKKRLDELSVSCRLSVSYDRCKKHKHEDVLKYVEQFIESLNFTKVETEELCCGNTAKYPVKLNGIGVFTDCCSNSENKVETLKKAIIDGKNILEFRYTSDSDLVILMAVKKCLDELSVPCTLFIWYMPYSRMDRKIEGDLFTLQYVTEFINWLNFESVVVMEPHSEKTMNLLERATAIYPVKDWLPAVQKEIGFTENDHIVFPDKGAAARYANSGYANICIMEKKRNPTTGKIEDMRLKEGKVNPGAKCIIIDDLCSKGGTFAWAGSILKSLGASEVYLIVSHCEETIFEGKLLTEGSPISKVYTSSSIMCKEHPNIQYMDVNVSNYAKQ